MVIVYSLKLTNCINILCIDMSCDNLVDFIVILNRFWNSLELPIFWEGTNLLLSP